MRITFVTCKFGNVERNSHCDVLHITPVRVARLVLDYNGVFAIKAYVTATTTKNPHFILRFAGGAGVKKDTGYSLPGTFERPLTII